MLFKGNDCICEECGDIIEDPHLNAMADVKWGENSDRRICPECYYKKYPDKIIHKKNS